MTSELLTTIMERMKDEEFTRKLLMNKTKEDVQAFLSANGIDCTIEQVKELGKSLKEQMDGKELSLDQLEDVAGGGLFDFIKKTASDAWDSITGWF